MGDLGEFSNLAEDLIAFFLIVMPRVLGFFTGFPLLGTSLISSLITRIVVAVAFSVFLHPLLLHQLVDFSEVTWSFTNTLKEFLIGWISGFILTLPLWVALMIGDIVESQRGGMATDNADPFTGVQSSAYGALITITVFLCIILYGPLERLIYFLYKSFEVWSVVSYFPDFSLTRYNGILIFTNILFETMVLLAAPLLIMMFLCEFGLALVNRFSPPLNVFILSMPVKSAISIFTLILVLDSMVRYLISFYGNNDLIFSIARSLLQ